MLVKLKILKGPNVGKEVKIPAPKCLIGREEGCHLRAQSDAVSRRHCVIITSESEVAVRDLNSRNGTYVNDQRITEEVILLSGDILRVGPLEFEAVLEQKPGKPKRPAVNDLKDVLTRTAGAAQSAGSTSELGDINKWLDEADAFAKAARIADPETRQFRIDDTDPGKVIAASTDTKSLEDAKKKVDEAKKLADEEEAKKKAEEQAKKKEPGKLPPQPQFAAKNSRDAAADTLKKFFNRR
jgi:pSer/pThr/pTyr-binding forkhead associated (FHA) protein